MREQRMHTFTIMFLSCVLSMRAPAAIHLSRNDSVIWEISGMINCQPFESDIAQAQVTLQFSGDILDHYEEVRLELFEDRLSDTPIYQGTAVGPASGTSSYGFMASDAWQDWHGYAKLTVISGSLELSDVTVYVSSHVEFCTLRATACGACSNNITEDVLNIPIQHGGPLSETATNLQIALVSTFRCEPPRFFGPAIFNNRRFGPGDAGNTFRVGPDDPDFWAFTAQLTNGLENCLWLCGQNFCIGGKEADYFGLFDAVDLRGFRISAYELHLDSLNINTPGNVQPGVMLDYYYTGVLRVFFRPELDITPYPGGIRCSWPANATNFVLETASSLSSSNWVPFTGLQYYRGEQKVADLSPATNTFFRLRR
jgi:hypothetical protein